jgi:hypothetical protein
MIISVLLPTPTRSDQRVFLLVPRRKRAMRSAAART